MNKIPIFFLQNFYYNQNNAITNYTCDCPIGYGGRHCEQLLSVCSNNPCENDGTCIDGPSGFLCACKLGYSGSRCQIRQKGCSPNPCHGMFQVFFLLNFFFN